MKQTIITILVATAVIGMLHLSSQRDAKVIAAAEAYEDCVLEEYNMTPAQYREINGNYPKCE